jgi:hypothetical protein
LENGPGIVGQLLRMRRVSHMGMATTGDIVARNMILKKQHVKGIHVRTKPTPVRDFDKAAEILYSTY